MFIVRRLLHMSKATLFLGLLCIALMAGCDALGGGDGDSGPTAAFRYQNFSHYEARREVVINDTVYTTSVTSRVNIVADGDTLFTSIPVTEGTGYLDVEAGDHSVEAYSYPAADLLAEAQVTLEAGTNYSMYTLGYGDGIRPVVLRETPVAEDASSGPAPLSGPATFQFLNGLTELSPVNIYVNQPAEVDSLEPNVSELDPVFSEVPSAALTGAISYSVSIDPEAEAGNELHLRVTPANSDTMVVYDAMREFDPETTQYFVLYDQDKSADDTLNVQIEAQAGMEAEKVGR